MKSHWTKFAAAAVIIVAVVVSITVLEKSPTVAYALEQTIQANHSVRTIHVKKYIPANEQPEEFWVEFDETGELYRCRMNMPKTADGPKEIVWLEDKAGIWLKAKNIYIIVHHKLIAEQLHQAMEVLDPKLAVQNLQHLQSEGKVRIEIVEPVLKGKPIVVTATYLENSPKPGTRLTLTVDATTKLVGQIEVYRLSEGDYEYKSRLEIQDYNKPIASEVFTLDLPADAIRIDQTTQDVGLAQGDLSDNEIAVKLVREVLEALIAKDYAKAGRLFQGVPAEFLEKQFAGKSFVRIVSIGQPKPSKWNKLLVPCEFEVEVDGKKTLVQANFYVREVVGVPSRWTVDGMSE